MDKVESSFALNKAVLDASRKLDITKREASEILLIPHSAFECWCELLLPFNEDFPELRTRIKSYLTLATVLYSHFKFKPDAAKWLITKSDAFYGNSPLEHIKASEEGLLEVSLYVEFVLGP